jgi:hypothetical protein
MSHFIFSLLLVSILTIANAYSESIYLERESKGKGEYLRVIGGLTPEGLERVIMMLKVKERYHPSGNFGFCLENSLNYFKKLKLFTNEKYNDFKYRLPIKIQDLSGHGIEEYRVKIPLEDYLSLDILKNTTSPDTKRWNGHIKVVDESGEEIASRFDQKHLTVSFLTTIESNSSKVYYLYFGKENVDEKEIQKVEPENILPHTPPDEDAIDITKNDKFGFSWLIKLVKEDPFGVPFWKLKSIPIEGNISPTQGNYFYKVTLILNKKGEVVDTFDWLVFKDEVNIPIFEDSYLEYDLRGEKMAPELAVGIFCRLHVPLRKVFSRQLFDHVTFDKGERDERGLVGKLSTDLNYYIDKRWYHRRIPLKEYAGKKIDHLYFKVKGVLENPENAPDTLTYYFDHVRITRGAAPEVLIKELEINKEWINR